MTEVRERTRGDGADWDAGLAAGLDTGLDTGLGASDGGSSWDFDDPKQEKRPHPEDCDG